MNAMLKVFLEFSDKHKIFSQKQTMDYPKINVQFGRVYIIPIHYLTYWRSDSPTTNSEIWMTTGNKYLSVRKFLGMCINHKRGHYTSGEGRNKTKRKYIYQSFVPVAKPPQYYTQYICFQPYCEVPKNIFNSCPFN